MFGGVNICGGANLKFFRNNTFGRANFLELNFFGWGQYLWGVQHFWVKHNWVSWPSKSPMNAKMACGHCPAFRWINEFFKSSGSALKACGGWVVGGWQTPIIIITLHQFRIGVRVRLSWESINFMPLKSSIYNVSSMKASCKYFKILIT